MKSTIALILFFTAFLAQAQINYFDNQYPYLQRPEAVYDISIIDSSYLMVGGESSNGSVFNNKIYLLKIGNNGELLQQISTDLGPTIGASARYILPIDSSFSFIQGTSRNYESVINNQLFLGKINHYTGDTIWFRQYGIDSLHENTGKAIKTTDGGIAITGWVFNDNYVSRIHLMKMDSLGEFEYYYHYTSDSTIKHEGLSLVQTEDEGFLILGFRRYWDEYEDKDVLFTDRFLLKTDAQGQQEWVQFYPALEDSLVKLNQHNWIIPLEDGNYLSGGSKAHFKIIGAISLETFWEYSITKYTPEGEIIWDKVYGENDAAFWNNAIESSSGNFVFVGSERDPPFPGGGRRQYGVIASTDSDGELLWLRKYYSAPEDVDIDFLRALVETPDGGYVACGDSFGPWSDSTYQNVWVVKTDSVGCLEANCDSIITATEEPFSPTDEAPLSIYPNPASDQLTIDIGENNTLLGIQIFDPSGKRVEDIQFFRSHRLHSHTLSIRQLLSGIYFVQVRTDQGWLSGKVVKQ
jgi:hypothetical protein